jgi:rRNA maturation endonuclease Nob1
MATGRFRCTACGNAVTVKMVVPRCELCGERLWEREESSPYAEVR